MILIPERARIIPDYYMAFVAGRAVRATGRIDRVFQHIHRLGVGVWKEVESMKYQGKEEKEKAELRHDSVLAGAETRFVPPKSMQEAGQCIL